MLLLPPPLDINSVRERGTSLPVAPPCPVSQAKELLAASRKRFVGSRGSEGEEEELIGLIVCLWLLSLLPLAVCPQPLLKLPPKENGLLRKEEEEEGRAVITAAFLPITEHHQTSLWVFGGGLPPPPPFPFPPLPCNLPGKPIKPPDEERERGRESLWPFSFPSSLALMIICIKIDSDLLCQVDRGRRRKDALCTTEFVASAALEAKWKRANR